MAECVHDMRPEWCSTCSTPSPKRQPLVLEGKTIPARFENKCGGCGDRVMVGEDIHLTDHGWVCTVCAADASPPLDRNDLVDHLSRKFNEAAKATEELSWGPPR